MTNTAKPLSRLRQWSGRLGWGLVSGISILLFLLPTQPALGGGPAETWLLIMLSLLVLSWLGMSIGIGLLLIRYLPFFQQFRGVLFSLGLLMVGLRLFTHLQPLAETEIFARILLVVSIWLFTLLVALVLALVVYMWVCDQSVRLMAVISVVLPWSFILYIRSQGPEKLWHNTLQGNLPPELMTLICFGNLLFLLAPLFFVGHTMRLVYREFLRAPRAWGKVNLPSPTLKEEIT